MQGPIVTWLRQGSAGGGIRQAGLVGSRPWLARALAFASGAVLPLAYAPFGVWPLAVVSVAVLFALWAQAGPRQAASLGYLFGLGQFGIGVSWVYNSIHLFGQAVAPLAGVVTLAFVLVLALFPALVGWLVRRVPAPSMGWQLVVVMPATWTLVEWLRGWFLTGFPWLLLGQSQVDSWLVGTAPIVGVYGVSWLVALSAGLLVLAGVAGLGTRAVAGIALAGIWLSSGLLADMSWTRPAGEPLRAALVQGNVAQEDKMQPDQMGPTLSRYASLSRPHWGDTDLVVWPETAVPTFYSDVAEGFLEPLAAEARSQGSDLLVGVFAYDAGQGEIYNSLMVPGADPARYDKRHLVPFGEYIPLRELVSGLGQWLRVPMSDLAAGRGRPLLEAAGRPLGVSICYEDAFGEEVIDALPRAELLVNVSNDAWFGDSIAPHQHLEIARMRAVETGRDMLRSTNTGISAVIGANGQIVARAPQFETHVLTGSVQPREGATPYVRLGNIPVAGLSALLLVATPGLARLRRRSPGART